MKDYNQIVNAFNFQTSDRLEKMQRQVDEYQRQRRNQTMIPTKNMDAISVGSGKNQFIFGRKGLIERSPLSVSSFEGLANGQQVINQMKVTNFHSGGDSFDITQGITTDRLAGSNILPIVERVVYVNSVSANNILPGGSNTTASQWQIVGDFYSHIDNSNGEDVELNEVANWRFIRNISAGTVDLIFHVYVRYIVNTG